MNAHHHTETSRLVEQDVLDRIDLALSSRGRHARVDATGLLMAGKLLAEFERRANNQVALHIRSVSLAQRRPTYAFFCEDEVYGALALHDRYGYVVLNVGIVLRIVYFCGRMMATDGLWTKIGKTKSAFSERVAAETACAHGEATSPPFDLPDDPLRLAFATVFAAECFDFIVRHELAHLVLGHCQFMAIGGHKAGMEDSDGRLAQGVDTITAQVLEIAADGHAAIWGVQKLPHVRERLGRLPSGVDEAHRWFHRTPDDSMLNYLLAMFFVFRLTDENAWNNETLTSRSHPPAPIRFHAACLHLIEHFKFTGDADAEGQLLGAMSEIWELGEIIFAQTLDRKADPRIKHNALSEKSEQHYNLLHDRAQTLPQSLFGLS